MNLAQMRTLLPLAEQANGKVAPGFRPVQIKEGEPVLDNLTPFTFPDGYGRAVVTVVLDRHGNTIHTYRTL